MKTPPTLRRLALAALLPAILICQLSTARAQGTAFTYQGSLNDNGGPANGTDILVTYLYKLAFRFGQLGKAAAISLVMFGVLLIFTLLYVALVSRNEEDAAPEDAKEA